MPTLFDDLLPDSEGLGGGLFDDLVPTERKVEAPAASRSAIGEFAVGVPRGAVKSTGAGVEGSAQLLEGAARKMGLDVSPEPGAVERTGASIRKFGEETFKRGQGQDVAAGLGEATGSFAPLVASGLIPGIGIPLVVWQGIAQGSNEAVERARQAGATQEQIDTAGLLGTIPGGSEFIPVELMLTRLPSAARKPLRDFAISTARAFGLEGSQEAVQAILQDGIERYVHSPQKLIGQDAVEQGLYGGGAGAIINTLLYPFLARKGRLEREALSNRPAPGETPQPGDGNTQITEPFTKPAIEPQTIVEKPAENLLDLEGAPPPPWSDPNLKIAQDVLADRGNPFAQDGIDERVPWGPGQRPLYEDENVTKAEMDYENFRHELLREPAALPPPPSAKFETPIGILTNRQAEELLDNNKQVPGVADILGQVSVPYKQRMDAALDALFRSGAANLQLPSEGKVLPVGNLGKRTKNKATGLPMGGRYPKADPLVPVEVGGVREDAQAMTGEQMRQQTEDVRTYVQSLKPGSTVDLDRLPVEDSSTRYEILRKLQKEGLVRRQGGDKRWVAKPQEQANIKGSVQKNVAQGIEPVAKLTPDQNKRILKQVEKLVGKTLAMAEMDSSFSLTRKSRHTGPGRVTGLYDKLNRVISVANNKGYLVAENTAAEEAFHHVQNWLATPREKRILESDRPTFLKILDDMLGTKWRTGYTEEELGFESEAKIAALYFQHREHGRPFDPRLKPLQRGVLEKIYRFFRSLSQWLRGQGFNLAPESSLDIFDQFAQGKFNERELNVIESTTNDLMRSVELSRDENITARRELEKTTLYDRWFRNIKDMADKYPALRPFERALTRVYEFRQQMLEQNAEDFSDFAGLSQKEQDDVTKWIVHFDRNSTPSKERASELGGVAPKVRAAMDGVYKGLERIWDENIKAFKVGLGFNETMSANEIRQLSKDQPGKKIFHDNVADVLEEMESRRDTSYFPRIRFGDHHVVVHDLQNLDEDGEPRQVWFQGVERNPLPWVGRSQTNKELQRVARSLRAGLFPESSRYRITTGQSTFDFFTRQLQDAPGVIDQFMNIVGTRQIKNENNELKGLNDIFKEIQDRLTHQVFRKRLTRKREGIPGWINKDNEHYYMRQALTAYSTRAAHFIARQRHKKDLDTALATIQSPDLAKFAQDVHGYTQSGEEEYQALKSMAFHWMLGANLSSAMMNFFQTAQATYPYALAMTGNPVTALNVVLKAGRDAARLTSFHEWRVGGINFNKKPEGISQEEWEGIKLERARGALLPLQMHELQGLNMTGLKGVPQFAKYLNKKGIGQTVAIAGEISASLFNYVEQTNRLTAYLVGHRLASQPKMRSKMANVWRGSRWEEHQIDPHMAGRAFVEDTQGIFSKETRPRILRGFGGLALQFTNYQFFMLNQWLKAAFQYGGGGIRNSTEARLMLGSYAFFVWMTAGLLGLPFMYPAKEGLEKLYELITEKKVDLDYTARKFASELGSPGWFIESLMKGPFRMTPWDISRRTSMEIIPTDFGSGTTFGPATQVLWGNIGEALDRFNRDDTVMGMAALAPLAVKNIAKAVDMGTRGGVRTRSDRILPVKTDAFDATSQLVGLTPSNVAQGRERLQVEKHLQTRLNELRDSYYDRLARYRYGMMNANKSGNKEAYAAALENFRDVLKEARDYDKGKPVSERLRLNMDNVTKRIRSDILAKQGRTDLKKMSPANRREALELDELYGGRV